MTQLDNFIIISMDVAIAQMLVHCPGNTKIGVWFWSGDLSFWLTPRLYVRDVTIPEAKQNTYPLTDWVLP